MAESRLGQIAASFLRPRQGERRSEDGSPPPEGERRTGDDRREPAGRDRLYGVLFSTAGGVEQLQEWLESSCAGRWSLGFDDLDTATGTKTLRLLFERPEDKAAFIAHFGRTIQPMAKR